MRAPAHAPADAGEFYPARFENPPGAPVIVVEAKTAAMRPEPGSATLPVVTLTNQSNRRVTYLKLRFKAGTPAHAVTAFEVDLPPRGTFVFSRGTSLAGSPERMHVQILGVRFDNGDEWGAFDSSIDTREPTVSVPQSIHRPAR